jgi:hypothetical protein
MSINKKHLLYKGKKFGLAGFESWTEYLTYLGDNRWEMHVEENPDSSFPNEKPFIEPFTTEALVNWVLERDYEQMEDEVAQDQIESDDEQPRKFYDYGNQLLAIAREEDAQSCIQILEGWLAGTWPPKPLAPEILRVTGVTKRGIWIRISRTVYSVDTDSGPGYLSPPNEDGVATLFMERASTTEASWSVKLSERFLSELEALKAEFIRQKASN